MDVSLRHWPIFVTGLLLGAAGTMSLGLHRTTQLELAALAAAQTVTVPAPHEATIQVGPEVNSQERVEEQMRAAAEGFRAQEALTAASVPFLVALAEPPKPRVRRVPKEVDFEAKAIAGPFAPSQAITTATPASEPIMTLRSSTSVMGAAPALTVMPARGSARAPDAGDIAPQPE